jgi:hypothetical protein
MQHAGHASRDQRGSQEQSNRQSQIPVGGIENKDSPYKRLNDWKGTEENPNLLQTTRSVA